MRRIYQRQVDALKDVERIRNVCIIAHVDHGKTTLSDNLLSANEIISELQAGKLRYLDSREDEQEREITMKSSAINLIHNDVKVTQEIEEDYLKAREEEKSIIRTQEDSETTQDYAINMIDSPGHIAFAFEVSSGLKVCDGAILVIDSIEGVCSQTITNLRKAVDEGLTIILVLNKIDKLINEQNYTPSDAFELLSQLIDEANAALSSALGAKILDEFGSKGNQEMLNKLENTYFFSPLKGNVVFGSAFDNWGFTIDDFAEIVCKKMKKYKFKKKALRKFLWGHYYFNPQTKKISTKPINDQQNTMFVEFILKNLFTFYEKTRYEKNVEWTEKMAKKFNAKISNHLLKNLENEWQTVTGRILQGWIPLHKTLMKVIIRHIPNPKLSQKMRIFNICKKLKKTKGNKILSQELAPFKAGIEQASTEEGTPVVAFIAKMNKVLDSHIDEGGKTQTMQGFHLNKKGSKLIGFGRVFSGTIRRGDTLKIQIFKKELISSKGGSSSYQGGSSAKITQEWVDVKIDHLYFWMGQYLLGTEVVYPGMIVGFGDLDHLGFKTATLSSIEGVPSLTGIKFEQNLLKVSLKTKEMSEMPKLIDSLQKILKSDPVIDVYYNEHGDLMLETGGEVHLERVLKDIEDELDKIELNVSQPIVSFKETIIKRKAKFKRRTKKDVLKKIIKENEEAFEEDKEREEGEKYKTDVTNVGEGIPEGEEGDQVEEMEEARQPEEDRIEAGQDQEQGDDQTKGEEQDPEKVYRYYSENSSFFETTEEEEEVDQKKVVADAEKKAIEEWEDEGKGEDAEDTWFIYKESDFLYQKRKEELVNVTRKGKAFKMDKINFIDMKKKKNSCQALTPNRAYRVRVSAIGLEEEIAQWLFSKKNKLVKMYLHENTKTKSSMLKFYHQFLDLLEASDMEEKTIGLIVRSLVNFGPRRSGNNLLCFLFADPKDTLFGQYIQDPRIQQYFKGKKYERIYDYSDKELIDEYYPGIGFSELSTSLENGFNVSLEHGPLCGEEMFGCVFIVQDFESMKFMKERELRRRKEVQGSAVKLKDESLVSSSTTLPQQESQSDSNPIATTTTTTTVHEEEQEGVEVQEAANNSNTMDGDLPVQKSLQSEFEGTENGENGQKIKEQELEREGEIEEIEDMEISEPKKQPKPIFTAQELMEKRFGPISGQILSTMNHVCNKSFLGAEPRLVQGVFEVTIYCEEHIYGKACDVLNKRKSKILESDYQDLTNLFITRALLPIHESFGFYQEMMSSTQGRVTPQLSFHSWSQIDEDPFYEPQTEDEIEEFGNKIFTTNYSRTLIKNIRERKGLNMEDKIVVAADKQNNVSRKRQLYFKDIFFLFDDQRMDQIRSNNNNIQVLFRPIQILVCLRKYFIFGFFNSGFDLQ